MIWKPSLLIIVLNKPELLFCTQLNSFKYSLISHNLALVICSYSQFEGNFLFK